MVNEKMEAALNAQLQEAITSYGLDFEGNINVSPLGFVVMAFNLPVTFFLSNFLPLDVNSILYAPELEAFLISSI